MNERFTQTPIFRILLAIVLVCAFVWVGYEMHQDITAYENGASGLRLNWLLMFAYDLLGKWGAIAAWTAASCLAVWMLCFANTNK